jgi:hypothetical protein
VIDARVRDDCRDRGSIDKVQPDKEQHDFVYALPSRDLDEAGARKDDELGHPKAQLRVYRPHGTFISQVLGRWPRSSEDSLFDAGAWDQAVVRWRARPIPDGDPDMVGADLAREGADETCEMPRWGEDAEALLRAYATARTEKEPEKAISDVIDRRQWLGPITVLPKGKGPETAERIARHYPMSPVVVDEGAVGYSVLDHARVVLGKDFYGVSFGAAAPAPTPGEPFSENMRTALYVRAAKMVALGLADVPDDPLLRQEIMAHKLMPRSRTVFDPLTGTKERKATVLLLEKDEIKKLIGRSPDRADTFVLAVNGPLGTTGEILLGRA